MATSPDPFLKKPIRTFSFGNEVDLSLTNPNEKHEVSATQTVDKTEYFDAAQPLSSASGLASNLEKRNSKRSIGSVRFEHDEITPAVPLETDRPYSQLTYSTLESIPYAESSRAAEERGSNGGQQYPSDFELFMAKSRADDEQLKERNWPTVEVESESLMNGSLLNKAADRRARYRAIRTVLRVLQVFASAVTLVMVSTTIAKVQDTDSGTQQNQENLWPDPLILWPEFLVTGISSFSFAISLLAVLTAFFIDRLSETKSRIGIYINFSINLLLFVLWIVAIVAFKVNSSTSNIWGFSCSDNTLNNAFVDYGFICGREAATWGVSILSAIFELGTLFFFLMTFIRYRILEDKKDEAMRVAEMRKSVHRTMTGRGPAPSQRPRRKGWEAGHDGIGTPMIKVIPAV